MTIADLLYDLKGRIGPGNIANDTVLTGWLNEMYLYMCDQIIQENPDYFTSSDTTNLILNQWEYWFPSNASQVVRVDANFTGTWKRLIALQDIGQIPVLADPTQSVVFTEANPIYYITGGKVGILPIPSQNVKNGLKMWFVQIPTELMSTQSPLFNSKYHRLISIGAYANYLHLDDQHGAAEQLMQRFEQRVQEMVQSIAERQVDQPKTIQVAGDYGLYVDELYTDGII